LNRRRRLEFARVAYGRDRGRNQLTTQQLHLFNCLYLALTIVVAFVTRATARRIAGALAGGVAAGVIVLSMISLGEKAGWWQFSISWEPYFVTLMLLDVTLCAFIFLITWRIARRFGWCGLAVFTVFAAVIGPPRDYWYMDRFPEWGAYAPGVAPVFAIAATYALVVLMGHGVMWLVAGPSNADRLARRSW